MSLVRKKHLPGEHDDPDDPAHYVQNYLEKICDGAPRLQWWLLQHGMMMPVCLRVILLWQFQFAKKCDEYQFMGHEFPLNKKNMECEFQILIPSLAHWRMCSSLLFYIPNSGHINCIGYGILCAVIPGHSVYNFGNIS